MPGDAVEVALNVCRECCSKMTVYRDWWYYHPNYFAYPNWRLHSDIHVWFAELRCGD
jgi:hypothetical protein